MITDLCCCLLPRPPFAPFLEIHSELICRPREFVKNKCSPQLISKGSRPAKMTSKPHLQIFNPDHIYSQSFHLFPSLQKELRCLIWQHALRRQRLIRVNLKADIWRNKPATESLDIWSARGRDGYSVVVDGYQVLSKLLRVNSEARGEALRFYRVHIPCHFRKASDIQSRETVPGVFHFNPEHDFLYLTSEPPIQDTLIQFCCDLKRIHDPRRVGLLNIAVHGLYGSDLYCLKPSDLATDVNTAFAETLAQLEEVFFVSTIRVGRMITGILSAGDITPYHDFINRSFPIMALAPTFERVHQDPRPIAEDLTNVNPGVNYQALLDMWHRFLLDQWRVPTPKTKYSFLLAFDGHSIHGVSSRKSAKRFVEMEDQRWNDTEPWSPRGSPEKVKEEDLSKAVRPAFGFWLFPVDAGPPLYREALIEGEKFRFQGKHIYDMSVRWPELALSSLP